MIKKLANIIETFDLLKFDFLIIPQLKYEIFVFVMKLKHRGQGSLDPKVFFFFRNTIKLEK